MTTDAPVRSIDPAKVAGRLGGRVLVNARRCAEDKGDIVAYAIVALYDDGRPFGVAATDWPEDYPCNRHMFVGMATELIRDCLITDVTAVEVVNEANGF